MATVGGIDVQLASTDFGAGAAFRLTGDQLATTLDTSAGHVVELHGDIAVPFRVD
jgi:hypothetical protein